MVEKVVAYFYLRESVKIIKIQQRLTTKSFFLISEIKSE